MDAGLILIGTELLTGKRRDAHLAHAIAALGRYALEVCFCTCLRDEAGRLVPALEAAMSAAEPVFVFGGIGATPDDLTRACAARAAGVALERHPEAAAGIEAHFGEAAYPVRIRMADLPQGCSLIPNPANRIPGFTIKGVHFLPGFPELAWPMLDWVLEQYHAGEGGARPAVEERLVVRQGHESELVDLMERFMALFPQVALSSLPAFTGAGTRIELGIRGRPGAVAASRDWLLRELQARGLEAASVAQDT